jgi:hypothetical protein
VIHKFLNAIRKNHAMEHATIGLLLEEGEVKPPVAGYATPFGFFVLGKVNSKTLDEAVNTAIRRLQAGEAELAVSPFCGTNLLVAATLASLSVLISVRGKSSIKKLPVAISSTLLGLLASQPIGRLIQQHFTTNAQIGASTIKSVSSLGNIHFVRTSKFLNKRLA